MKKLLLFCLVLLSSSIYSQLIQLTVPNKIQCNGNTTFDLTTMNSIISAQNPTLSTVANFDYYLTNSDALLGTNFITNPTNFVCTNSPQTIFVRTNSAVGTDGIGSFNLVVDSPILATATITTPITCMNNAVITTIASGGSGGYMYTLVDLTGGSPSITSSNNIFNNVDFGFYEIVVTDSLGCTTTVHNIIIAMPIDISCSATVTANSITMNVSGGVAPYTFAFNGLTYLPINVFTDLSPGMYTIQVRDANGCTCTSTVSIPNNGFSVTLGSTLDIPVSTFMANVSGGVAPFTYQWSYNGVAISGAISQSINTQNLCGQFSVLVTDANGLFATANATPGCFSISANNDTFSVYPSNIATATSSVSVLSNDFFNGLPVNSPTNNVTLTPLTIPVGFMINANGTISVLSGTPSGIYTLGYQICQNTNPNNCSTAIVIITIPSNGIILKAFIDSNNNSIQDNGETNFTQGQFGYELNSSGVINHITSSNGEFLINESNATNSYNLSYSINPAGAAQYSLSTPSYNNVHVSGSGVTIYNFPITEIPFTDLAVYVYNYGAPPRPGFTYVNQINYRNSGNQTIASGTVTFVNNNIVAITTISQTGTIPTVTGFTYDFTNLLPGESRYINVTMQVPTIPTVTLGQLLTNSVSTTIPSGDINIANNNSSISQIIVGSYDPNDKVESHGGKIVHSAFTTNDYLTYTIQFENTGTANAENVRVNDMLDAKLDETSIKMVDASYSYILNRVGNTLNWNFNGIELIPNGKGSLTFQIKPKSGYVVGDIIPNTASIFFDFNPAIVTNTFNTEFVSALGISEFENKEFVVYPNPTNGIVVVSLKNNSDIIDSIIVNDVLGKTIFSRKINSFSSEIDLSNVSKGIYFIKIKSREQEKVQKIIKN
jgi:uncharacterized repeat protein (TIGR01451 family)